MRHHITFRGLSTSPTDHEAHDGSCATLTNLIAEDNPELGPNECIERSMAMMDGHKMDLFLLDLSYIGWMLLGIISCGIGLLWVAPWMQMAHVKFYEQLKAEAVAA